MRSAIRHLLIINFAGNKNTTSDCIVRMLLSGMAPRTRGKPHDLIERAEEEDVR
jgi:hypothetical protein